MAFLLIFLAALPGLIWTAIVLLFYAALILAPIGVVLWLVASFTGGVIRIFHDPLAGPKPTKAERAKAHVAHQAWLKTYRLPPDWKPDLSSPSLRQHLEHNRSIDDGLRALPRAIRDSFTP